MPTHLTRSSATINHDQVFPGFGSGAVQTVPAGILFRIVTATFRVMSGSTGSSEVNQTVTPNGGGAAFDIIGKVPGSSLDIRAEATIVLKPGGTYWFGRGVASGGAVEVVDYSYADIGVA